MGPIYNLVSYRRPGKVERKKKIFSAFMDAVIFYLEIAGTTIRFTM